MDDKEILGHIDELIQTEHELRAKLAAGELSSNEEHARLRAAEEALDGYWDLLRQRRAGASSARIPGSRRRARPRRWRNTCNNQRELAAVHH